MIKFFVICSNQTWHNIYGNQYGCTFNKTILFVVYLTNGAIRLHIVLFNYKLLSQMRIQIRILSIYFVWVLLFCFVFSLKSLTHARSISKDVYKIWLVFEIKVGAVILDKLKWKRIDAAHIHIFADCNSAEQLMMIQDRLHTIRSDWKKKQTQIAISHSNEFNLLLFARQSCCCDLAVFELHWWWNEIRFYMPPASCCNKTFGSDWNGWKQIHTDWWVKCFVALHLTYLIYMRLYNDYILVTSLVNNWLWAILIEVRCNQLQHCKSDADINICAISNEKRSPAPVWWLSTSCTWAILETKIDLHLPSPWC